MGLRGPKDQQDEKNNKEERGRDTFRKSTLHPSPPTTTTTTVFPPSYAQDGNFTHATAVPQHLIYTATPTLTILCAKKNPLSSHTSLSFPSRKKEILVLQ